MLTITLNEAELNQVKAALDERIARLERNAEAAADKSGQFPDIDLSRAIVWTNDAILQSKSARDKISDPEVDHPDNATAWTEGELSEAYGR